MSEPPDRQEYKTCKNVVSLKKLNVCIVDDEAMSIDHLSGEDGDNRRRFAAFDRHQKKNLDTLVVFGSSQFKI